MQLAADGKQPDLAAHLEALDAWKHVGGSRKRQRTSKWSPEAVYRDPVWAVSDSMQDEVITGSNVYRQGHAAEGGWPVARAATWPLQSGQLYTNKKRKRYVRSTVTVCAGVGPDGLPSFVPLASVLTGTCMGAAQPQVHVLHVPRRYVAKVIGKGGWKMAEISQESGAKVKVEARQLEVDPCPVILIGTKQQIEEAQRIIWSIVDSQSVKTESVLEVPPSKIGKVIGLGGVHIQYIQSTTGAKLDVEKDCDPCRVRIYGDEHSIARATSEILTATMEAMDEQSKYLFFERGAAGAILGVQGSRLQELQAQSGARIDVDKSHATICRVRIAGTGMQIDSAAELLFQVVPVKGGFSAAQSSPQTSSAPKQEYFGWLQGSATTLEPNVSSPPGFYEGDVENILEGCYESAPPVNIGMPECPEEVNQLGSPWEQEALSEDGGTYLELPEFDVDAAKASKGARPAVCIPRGSALRERLAAVIRGRPFAAQGAAALVASVLED